jgi:hypothetical protein
MPALDMIRRPFASARDWLRGCTLIAFALLASLAIPPAIAQTISGSISGATSGLERQEGYMPFWWDESKSQVYLEIPAFDTDVLYYVSAATGGGSVEMGLDRGLMDSKVIHFQRSGSRVLVVQQNLTYNALGGSAAAAINVSEAFPTAVIAALPIVAIEGDRVLVDGNPLFIRDAAGVAARASRLDQGAFRFDAARSGFYPPRMKAFPENTEIETIITFEVQNAGVVVRAVAADQGTFTMRIHHSFLKAPEAYVPREGDPRIGIGGRRMRNQAAPFDDSTEVTWISRWRLQKKDPTAAMSEPVKPIIVYLDLAIPEPIRSAAREGLLWWNQSFEAAGFLNAIEVRDPTPDMDPMDSRYAWMLWIDRDERGFSSGGGFTDPRTGEILSPKTRMDSHRIRTIANYWESWMAATEGYEPGPNGYPAGQEALVTLRYASLTAHEFGHSLGFGHNWAASVDERSSVMDYPIPRVKVVDGKLDLSEAYAVGIGPYDTFMVRYSYTEFTPAAEAAELDAIIAEMREDGIQFVPDTDPRWSWYDDRSTPTEFLTETMAAREIMLAQYGPDILEAGEPLGALRDMRLWMTFMHHRWAIEAAQKYVGGMYHNIVVKGESLTPTEIVPATLQREVLSLLMNAISPGQLALPESLLAYLTPHPGSNMEDLSNDYAFDQLRAARILAGLVIGPLLDADRAARLVAFAARDPETVTLPELVQTLLANTWHAQAERDPALAALLRVTQGVTLDAMMMLAASADTSPDARNYLLVQLAELEEALEDRSDRDPMTAAHYLQSARNIDRFLDNPTANVPASVLLYWGDRPRSRWPDYPGPPL